MVVKAIRTRKFLPPKDDLWDLLNIIKSIPENSVVAITSKVVAIAEGRSILRKNIDKDRLIIQEADKYLPRNLAPHQWAIYTIKNNMLVASAGIDESNGKDFYILWPQKPDQSAAKIWKFLKKKFLLKNLGIIITDSRLIPLRRGVVGMAIAYFGFKPIKDYRGKKDIFGREFLMETSDIPDSLASAAVLEMGEGSEQAPIALITDIADIEFIQRKYHPKNPDHSFEMPEKDDLFYPFLSSVPWEQGGGG